MFGWYQIASCFKMILKCFVPVAPNFTLKEYHNTCFRVEAFSIKRATTGYPTPLKPDIYQSQKDLRLPQMSGNIIEESYCDKMITKYAAADQHKQSYVFVMNVEVKMHIYRFQENSHSDGSYCSAESASLFICWHI